MRRRTGRRFGLVALVAACAASPASAKPPAIEPSPPIETVPAEAGIRILSPASGSRVSQTVELRLGYGGTSGRDLTMAIDGEPPSTFKEPASSILIDTTRFRNGKHVVKVSITGDGGKVRSHSIDLVVDNRPYRLDGFSLSRQWVQNGSPFWIDARYEGETSSVKVSADLSQLDSGWTPGTERVEVVGSEARAATFRIHYTVTEGNRIADGKHAVLVTARDPSGAVTHPIDVELANVPPPPFEILTPRAGAADPSDRGSWDLAAWSDVRLPPIPEGTPRAVTVVEGDGSVLHPDGEAVFRVRLERAPGPRARLIVRPTGFSGWYGVILRPDQTEAALHVKLLSSAPPFRTGPVARGAGLAFELSLQAGKSLSAPTSARYQVVRPTPPPPFPPKGTRR